jgi:hypothetical protein
VVQTDVLLIEAENKPGALADVSAKLAAADINIEYCYTAVLPSAKRGLLVLRASDAKKALKVLNS